jgi:ubiquinone/menaquinone biosynthesis C-methylase UbiE
MVIIAQAYHWCPDYDAASAEFARVLKPGGVVVFIWNLENRDGARWVAQLRDAYEKFEHGTPQFRLGLWRATFDTPSYKAHFAPPEEKEWSYNLIGSLDIVQSRVLSKSYIAVRSADEKEKISEDVKAIIDKGEELTWKDDTHTEFDYPYKTFAVISRVRK